MASTIDFSSLTLNNEEARSTSEVVFEKTFSRPELAQVHGIQTGVEMDKYIPIFGQYGLVGKVDPGSCNNNTSTDQIPTSELTWTPKMISFKMAHCQDDIPAKLKFWKKSRIAANTWEEVDNEMMAYITDTLTDAVIQSQLRIVEFGDTAAETVTLGGHLTAGTDKTFFNMLDGVWKQVFTDQAGSAEIYRYTIDENSLANKTAQTTLASDRALKVLRNMYNNIDPRAFDGNNLTIQLTRSLWNNWNDFLEDKSLVFQLDRAEKGSTNMSYRGIPIIVRNDWDRMIRTYHDKGTTYYIPHRAMLVDINNVPVGTSDEESLTTVKSWYSQDDEKHYMKVAYKIDVKILLKYAMAVAY